MAVDFQDAKTSVADELKRRRLEMTPKAMAPLRAIDFARLVGIYDHEERFLREVFISSLVDAHRARTRGGTGTKKINAQDVQTAMLMLGSAVSAADEQTFSRAHKSIVREICPYCGGNL